MGNQKGHDDPNPDHGDDGKGHDDRGHHGHDHDIPTPPSSCGGQSEMLDKSTP
jgi:hypothetical protein